MMTHDDPLMNGMFTASHVIAHVRPTADDHIDESGGDEGPQKSRDETLRDSDAGTDEATPAPQARSRPPRSPPPRSSPTRSSPTRSPPTPRRTLVHKVSNFALRRKSPSGAQEVTPAARVSMDGTSPMRMTPIKLRGYLEETDSDDSKADETDSTHNVRSAQREIGVINTCVKELADRAQHADFSANVNILRGTTRDSRSTQTNMASPIPVGHGCKSPASAAGEAGIFDDTDDSREISETRSATHGNMLKNRTKKNRVAPVNPHQRPSDTCSTASEISTITTSSSSISRTTRAKVPQNDGTSRQLDGDKLQKNHEENVMKGEKGIGGFVDGCVGLENSSGGDLNPMKHTTDREKTGPARCACALM